ncbi:DUF4920 domain-containing protein [Mucilaginibacter ginkgonis]|uniref:DUF4920 domain-containing protein n=1 Tax=Mucilaginibacter ginkgonis TaxID=2682091 RepID=A0A6I4I7U7_9SPHI|nr:DUF4920 domain-containing protein [Mucilaginibacter ginkgonis]QQL49066.1 DUF4920 domain-containing protein [Mucilaginibacter ginkgonis]
MKKLIFIAALACTGVMAKGQTITPAKAGVTYGKTVTAYNAVSTDAINGKFGADSVYNGKITGTVVEVCKKKGCFMKLAQANGSPIMVQFTDYAYFMPQDIVGKTVVVEGTAKMKQTSVASLKHYAADAGKSPEEIAKISQPKKDISIMADGVLVVK